jgi:AcrR family transcriptional regulator
VKKKHAIIKAACRLFADQGFAGTSTLQISREAGATEPLIFYHFDGKDALFTSILETSFAEYFIRLDALPESTETQFEKIENLISMHLEFVKEMPHETKLIVSTCPAYLWGRSSQSVAPS